MDQNFNKVFWDACANGDFPMVCSQIKAGADVNYQNGDGRTALMRASKVGLNSTSTQSPAIGNQLLVGDDKSLDRSSAEGVFHTANP